MTHDIVKIFVCVLLLVVSGSTFILDLQKCIAHPPCSCLGDSVYCTYNSLTVFPKFQVSNLTGTNVYLYLHNNEITSVPANAFRNLTASNTTNIILQINNNKINNISIDAFTAIADRITELDLGSNNLTHVPLALKSLSNLNYLNLQDNPITSLSSSYDIFHSLRYSMQTILIDLKGYAVWPSELKILTSLKTLYVRYLNYSHLEDDAFIAFQNTLTSLSIHYSQLERIPDAVCHLRNLKSLTFANNRNIDTKSPISKPCKQNLTSVTSINLKGNNMRSMSNVLRNFPSLVTLKLNYNNLSYIHWESVPSNLSVSSVYMSNNDFTRIPSALRKLQKLVTLSLAYNKITSIEDFDLDTFSQLRNLYIYGNPLEYISPNAFTHNSDLSYLDLHGTKLYHLPNSLAGLQNLETLRLSGVPIECNCDLSFMKALNVSLISLTGKCQSNSLYIKTYLTDHLPFCS